ncbi:nitroreductase [Sneathiella sp. CAU 1612]|uniref:Nitroreductase n=1 Tax=Sneathiella sedimenti TaxID=2816034 RepID=A0ABS3F5S1_9PROT|nr:nitroreductase [uncultured Sneathiella sp.]MBO0333826.1 nitroreductase [Sneathiella sedimenti]
MKVSEAIKSRMTVRQFLDKPVPEKTIREIIETAKRAPSGGNLQPWTVHVLVGQPLQALIEDIDQKVKNGQTEDPEYNVYPPELVDPYKTRRRVVGQQLYDLIGVPRSDTPGKLRQLARNYRFFDAPVGMFFVLHRQMEIGQYADVGMFMENIMLLAREYGLDTCPQEAWARWPVTLKKHLSLADHEMLFCGMALGYKDEAAVINELVSEREEFDKFVTLHGFEE